MNLTSIGHLENKYIRKMKRLNREAFPKQERIPFDKLVDLSNSKDFDFLAIKEENQFVGFFMIAKNTEIVYLFFFAVTKKQQTEESGDKLLALLKEYYPYQQIVLDLEVIEEGPDVSRREAKKDFYVSNGFIETGFELQHAEKFYELLSNKEPFNREEFLSLLEDISPVINEIKNGTFSPVLKEKRSI